MASTDASSLSAPPKQEATLTPLGQRLVLALRHVAQQHDELQMAVRGFERYLRKNPIADEDIRGGLNTIREHIALILDDAPSEVTQA
jgi:hypothetical protein